MTNVSLGFKSGGSPGLEMTIPLTTVFESVCALLDHSIPASSPIMAENVRFLHEFVAHSYKAVFTSS